MRSISTLDLPSPAITSKDPEKTPEKKSWVWRWAKKQEDADGVSRIYCTVPRCTQKKGWKFVRGSTSNIRTHLISDHKLNDKGKGVDAGQPGSIENAFTAQGKRSSAHFSTDLFEQQVCKVMVHHKLPYTFVQSGLLQDLLVIAHSAPSKEDLKLPSKDTISRRVSELYIANVLVYYE